MLSPSEMLKKVREAGIVKVAFLNTICMAFSMGTISNLIVQKVCSPKEQPSINNFICTDPQLVAEATSVTITKSTLRAVCGSISGTFFGSWRDSTGLNKPLLYIGLSAELFNAFLYAFTSWRWSSDIWLPSMLDALVAGLFGMSAFQLGLHCFVSENTKPEELTLKLQMMHTMTFVGFLIATPLRGFILTSLGYQNFFLLTACLYLFNIYQVHTSIHEKPKVVEKKQEMDMLGRLKAVFRSRPNNVAIWAMMISKPLFMTFFQAEHTIQLYFLQQGFGFTVKEETIFGTYGLIITTIGSIASPLLFTKVLKWSDFRMGITCCSMTTLTAVLTAFATTKTHLYLIALLDVVKFNLFTIPQSILNRCIKNDELGVYTGFSGALGVFFPFGINYLYSTVFSATSKTMPGAVFLISAVGNLIILALFVVAQASYVPQEKKEEEESLKADEKKVD
ncbi:uncharacterized protein [Halyomorpha halys]|uniref:uncharacterized protein n=1 Tax=Halyomorpha halys TaxID=286706 RepID=UPI000D0C8017|nr:uncharacterized protein LOC106678401 [Halyomorpha halys]